MCENQTIINLAQLFLQSECAFISLWSVNINVAAKKKSLLNMGHCDHNVAAIITQQLKC